MMNKITVTVGGKERVFRYDMYALELFVSDLRFKGQFAYVAKLIYAGLSSACYAQEKENDFTFEDVLDMVDELSLTDEGKEKLKLINECLANAQAFKSLLQASENAEKKTLIGTESTPSPSVK